MASVTPETPRFDVATYFAGITVTGSTVLVASGASIASGISTALAEGKAIVELAADGVYSEAVSLPAHSGTGFMVLRTQNANIASGTRVTPALAASNHFAAIQAPDNSYGLAVANGARRWIVESVEVRPATTNLMNNALVIATDANGAEAITTFALLASRVSFRHLYVHGLGQWGIANRRRGVALGASLCEFRDSWVSQINYDNTYSYQGQAIAMASGVGHVLIDNCFLWGCSEPIAFGGSSQYPACARDQVGISDVTIRKCHFYRPPNAMDVTPSENGIEFKIGRRVVVEDCIIENTWPSDQQKGMGCLLWSVNQAETDPWVQTCDVTFRRCWFKNCAGLGSWNDRSWSDSRAEISLCRARMENCFMTGMGGTISRHTYLGGPQVNFQGRIWEFDPNVADVAIERCLMLGDGADWIFMINMNPGETMPFTRFDFRNNVFGHINTNASIYFDPGFSTNWWANRNANGLNRCENNVHVTPLGAGDASLPSGNDVVTDLAALGLVDDSLVFSQTVKYADLAGLAFAPTSDFYGTGQGPDWSAVLSGLSGVEAPATQLALYD